MLLPFISLIILAGLIRRAAKKYQVPMNIPLSISILLFIIFIFAAKGSIRVTPDNLAIGLLLSILMYASVIIVIYAGVLIWMSARSTVLRDPDKPVSNGASRFMVFLGIKKNTIDWRYPLGLYIGALGATLFLRLASRGYIRLPEIIIVELVFIALMVIGYHLLRKNHYIISAFVIALVYGVIFFIKNLIIYRVDFFYLFSYFFSAFAFMLFIILMLNLIRNPWIALASGYFLAVILSFLKSAIYISVVSSEFLLLKIFISKTLIFILLESIVFSAIVFGLYKLLKLDLELLTLRSD